MKKYTLLFSFIFSFFIAQAQVFKPTKQYIAKSEIEGELQANEVHILDVADASERIAVIPTSLVFSDLHISVLTSPDLKDIHEIIKVEFEYEGYNVEVDTYYFLATNKGTYIALPKVINVYDEILEHMEDYIFPIQKYGQEGTIIKAKYKFTENYAIEGIEIIQSIVFNDDDFDYEEAVTAIQ